MFQTDVEETMKRIQSHKGVIGIIVANTEGMITQLYKESITHCL